VTSRSSIRCLYVLGVALALAFGVSAASPATQLAASPVVRTGFTVTLGPPPPRISVETIAGRGTHLGLVRIQSKLWRQGLVVQAGLPYDGHPHAFISLVGTPSPSTRRLLVTADAPTLDVYSGAPLDWRGMKLIEFDLSDELEALPRLVGRHVSQRADDGSRILVTIEVGAGVTERTLVAALAVVVEAVDPEVPVEFTVDQDMPTYEFQ